MARRERRVFSEEFKQQMVNLYRSGKPQCVRIVVSETYKYLW